MINYVAKNKQVVILVALLLISLCALFIYNSEAKSETPNNRVNMALDLTESYDSIKDLKDSATVIAKVKINDANSYEYENVVFTLSTATVTKMFKGESPASGTINILETGGYGDDKLSYLPEGNSVFSENEEAIVFLEKYVGPVAENAYVIKGVYEGKFKLNGDKVTPPLEVQGELKSIRSIGDLGLK